MSILPATPYPLNESDTLQFFHEHGDDINRIQLSPSGSGGAVIMWDEQNRVVLAFKATDGFVYLTDISMLTPQQISNLGVPAISHGMVYFLPSEIVNRVTEVLAKVGTTAENLAGTIAQVAEGQLPFVGQLTLPIIAIGIIGLVYLMKR